MHGWQPPPDIHLVPAMAPAYLAGVCVNLSRRHLCRPRSIPPATGHIWRP